MGGRGEMAMAILRRPGFPLTDGTSDAVPSLSCSVHEEGGYGHDVPAPGWEVRRALLSSCTLLSFVAQCTSLFSTPCVVATFEVSSYLTKHWSGLHERWTFSSGMGFKNSDF